MSFFKGLFGRSKPGATSPATSIAGALAQSKTPLAPERCGTCGTTFMNAQWLFTLITKQPAAFKLDVGGYCPRCAAYRCHQHARLQNVERPNIPPLPDPRLKGWMWGLACGLCGAALRPAPGIPPDEHTTILDPELLASEKPGPKKDFASPSGKLSLAKVAQNNFHLTLVPMSCDLCGAAYQHVPKMLPFSMSLSASQYEVDVGGFCAAGCGYLCPKHLRMGEYVLRGQKVRIMLCAKHGYPVIPNPGAIP